MAEPSHRSGVVALLGRPNAGKSTLLNRLLGERLAIVTPRPQTTRSRLLGVLSRPDAQLLFFDTPGLHEGRKALNRALDAIAREAAEDCDVALVLVDLARGGGGDPLLEGLFARLEERGVPVVLAGTKLDAPGAREADFPPAGAPAGAAAHRVSAHTGEGARALVEALVARLPEGPPFHPEDALTDRPLRFLVAELVREAAFEALEQEVPYETAVEVEHFDASRPDLVRVRATLLVERRTQKGIVVGRGGAMIRHIGTRARERLEDFLGRRVHLELWVKVEPRWSRRAKRLESLGYH